MNKSDAEAATQYARVYYSQANKDGVINPAPAAKLAYMRVRELRPCAQCGEYEAMLKVQKYCSETCKQAAKRARSQRSSEVHS